MKKADIKTSDDKIAKLIKDFSDRLTGVKPDSEEHAKLLAEFFDGITLGKPGEDGLADLIKEFLEKVAPKAAAGSADNATDNIWEGLIEFEKGIFKLNKIEVKAGWSALQIVKEMLSLAPTPDDRKLRFITRLEWRILERMWFLSDGFEINLGTGLRDEFARWTGKFEFFAGTVMPDITFYLSTNGAGGGRRSQSHEPVRTPSSVGFNQETFLEDIGAKFISLRTHLESVLKTATLSSWQQFALYTGWLMSAAALILAVLIFLNTRHLPESVNYVKEVTLDTKKSGEDNAKTLDKITGKIDANFSSVQDSLNKLMPKKAKAAVKAKK